ncbi:hypothetical protein J7413_08585 [Shimia sp. R10_1]|uniref:hypothetical protein n=1 Tax=Shimia sp. R10_1 TaxID=2821095 RepID=UPI001ADD13F9|nr:hypothetical protein [Shimia sp. R10_1]MBO9473592.1 hypothetical protein [Shimia sp. R10_1]
MKKVILAVGFAGALGLSGGAALAEDEAEGRSLMEEGALLFFKGLQEEMAPALEGLQSFMDEAGPSIQAFMLEMGPKLGEVFSQVKDWSQYHAPEMLPNGDIILRKKTPQELELEGDDSVDDNAIEL